MICKENKKVKKNNFQYDFLFRIMEILIGKKK